MAERVPSFKKNMKIGGPVSGSSDKSLIREWVLKENRNILSKYKRFY